MDYKFGIVCDDGEQFAFDTLSDVVAAVHCLCRDGRAISYVCIPQTSDAEPDQTSVILDLDRVLSPANLAGYKLGN